jgi:hypothetical protein
MKVPARSSVTGCSSSSRVFLTMGRTRPADTIVLYEAIGMGQWFRYVAGSIEVTTAVSLLTPLPTSFAGIGLALTVVEAGLTYLALISHSG